MKKVLLLKWIWSRTIKSLLLQSLFLVLLTSSVFAQKNIKGQVLDEKSNPLQRATIRIVGSNRTTQSDKSGNFTISAASDSAMIVVSYIGNEPKDVAIVNQNYISISLVKANATMGEVVVIGYGTQRKSDLTGAISSVSAKDLEKATPINATEALQGRAARVQVTSTTGAPGSEGTIRIRGIGTVNNNDPIYVVDGMFVTSINYLSPSDIARIEVLKDASDTAIYGSRGANGVILISTFKGQSGKPVIVFNSDRLKK